MDFLNDNRKKEKRKKREKIGERIEIARPKLKYIELSYL